MRRPKSTDHGKRSRELDDGDKENAPPAKKSRCKRAGDEISLEQQDEQDYQECVDKLHCQLEKERPKRKTVKKLMKATFAGRRQWIKDEQPAIATVLEKFPCLSTIKHLRADFTAVLDGQSDYESAEEKWELILPKISRQAALESRGSASVKSLLERQKVELDHFDGDDIVPKSLTDAHALEQLQHLLIPRCKRMVLHKASISSDIDASIDKIQQAEPYILLSVGEGSLQFFIVAEKQIFCESSSLIDAIKDVFATYFVFDIQYPKATNPVLIFLQRFLLDIKDSQPIPACVTRLISMMDNQ